MLRNILNTNISDDGTTLEEILNDLFSHRSSLPSQKIDIIAGKLLQPLLTADKIFSLEKYGSNYYMKRSSDNTLHCPDGYYFFIIPISEPYKILCAELRQGEPEGGKRYHLEGHSSFIGRLSVYFAGIIKFTGNRLDFWNNASGHFMPTPEKRYNFLPHIKLILPEHLFRTFRFDPK